jgi:hypothetical protein
MEEDPEVFGRGGRKSKGISKMKNLHEQFSDEEKQHLNYLGSMMGRPNTAEEQELEDILEAMEKARPRRPAAMTSPSDRTAQDNFSKPVRYPIDILQSSTERANQ